MADRALASPPKQIWMKQAEEAKIKSEAEKTAAAFEATFKAVKKRRPKAIVAAQALQAHAAQMHAQSSGDRPEIDKGLENPQSEAAPASRRKKKEKKRTISSLDSSDQVNYNGTGATHDQCVEYSMDEPTMAEKLASLELLHEDKLDSNPAPEPPPTMKPPSADSVHVLLKQALHAEDHALLLDCLYTRDEKVIAKSISLLNPAGAVKLLKSLLSLVGSRGAVLICVLPWLKSLLSQHTSSIISQESSLLILNSLYQLIESRISTYGSAVQLSTSLDYLFTGITYDEFDEEVVAPPVIYEDQDSEEEESSDVMDTDDGESEGLVDEIDSTHDSEGSEVMSD